MSDIDREIPSAIEAEKRDASRDVRTYLLFILGISVFVLLTGLTIFVCNNCVNAKSINDLLKGSVSFLGSLTSACAVLVLWSLAYWALRKHMHAVIRDQTVVLMRTVSRLAGQPEGNVNGLVPQMHTALKTLETGLRTLEDLAITESLAKRHIIAYSDAPSQALTKLVDELIEDPHEIKALRIVATGRGIYGDKTYELGKYVVRYLQGRIEANRPTFKEVKMLSPYHPSPPAVSPNLRLYPLCARHFALHTLVDMLPIVKKNEAKTGHLPIVISLSFAGRDAFPAWHLWCDSRLVILPALGYEDYEALGKALPIAIMARNPENGSLTKTFTRLAEYFDDMFGKGEGGGKEMWILDEQLTIKARGVVAAATGVTKDDDVAITKLFPKWEQIISGAETQLTPDEAKQLVQHLGKYALLDV